MIYTLHANNQKPV